MVNHVLLQELVDEGSYLEHVVDFRIQQSIFEIKIIYMIFMILQFILNYLLVYVLTERTFKHSIKNLLNKQWNFLHPLLLLYKIEGGFFWYYCFFSSLESTPSFGVSKIDWIIHLIFHVNYRDDKQQQN